jgi:predicted nucleic acid-binding protein
VATASEAADERLPLGPLYCDASALAKLFWPEPGSGDLNALVAGRDDLLVSELGMTEVVSALARRVREGGIAADAAAGVHRRLVAVAAQGAFTRVELLPATHREAERLLLASSPAPLRAIDALHLALALGAGAGTLLTYDRTMARGAAAQRLPVWPG